MDAVHLVAQQVDAPVVRVQIVADMAQCGGIGLAPDCLPAMKDPPVVEAQRAQVRRHAGKRALQAQQAVGRLNVDGFAILEQAVLHVGERSPEHPGGAQVFVVVGLFPCGMPSCEAMPSRTRDIGRGVSAQRVVRLVRRVPAIRIVHARDGPDGVAATQQRFAVRTERPPALHGGSGFKRLYGHDPTMGRWYQTCRPSV